MGNSLTSKIGRGLLADLNSEKTLGDLKINTREKGFKHNKGFVFVFN